MRRRDFMKIIGSAAAGWPLAARAQQSERTRRIGMLMAYADTDPEAQIFVRTFVEALAEIGWIEGRNLRTDLRWAAGDIERMHRLAQEMVAARPDLILANTSPVTAAFQRETRTIPIVFVIASDPVGDGFIASLAQPGGNITGFINLEGTAGGKWLELLKEAAPGITRAALMFNPDTAPGGGKYFLPSFEVAARTLRVEPIALPVRSEADIEAAIAALAREPGGGLVVPSDGFMRVHRGPLIASTARHKVPAVYALPILAVEGGLIAFGPYNADLFRRAAPYVDRILRGGNPGELPVQVPTKFELVVNLKTARALGLDIPPTILVRADNVIE
jgi:putative tryptophan/tyrosine transport system substrate-binding protein